MMKKGANYQMSVGFTIQNVSIKLTEDLQKVLQVWINLQYKMFLLNFSSEPLENSVSDIYNTKCFY